MIIQCKCKCGTEFEEYNKWGRKREFIYGHSNRGINNPNYGKHHSPETKQKMKENRPDTSGENNPMYGKHRSPETRQKISENHVDNSGEKHPFYGKKLSSETKQLMSINHIDVSGENNPNWQGGISKEPYCPIWTKWFKEEIKERDNFQCQNPNCNKKITKNNLLGVHHIDYDKKNCSTDNLITLCRSCNSRANSNREYWIEFYKNIIRK